MKTNTKVNAWIGLSLALLVLGNRCGKNDSEHTENVAHAEEVHWGYEGEASPDSWGELSPEFVTCAEGKAQSPVDLVDVASQNLPKIMFNYEPTALNLINNGHTIQATYGSGSSIEVDGAVHELRQLHFMRRVSIRLAASISPWRCIWSTKILMAAWQSIGALIGRGHDNESFTPIWEHLPASAGEELFVKEAA